MDVTYVHIAGYHWWYAVTVVDYYLRYLLSIHLAQSFCVFELIEALKTAREEAQRVCGELMKQPFLLTGV